MPTPEVCPTILVVDDEEYLRRIVIRTLTEKGYECDQATSGSEALDLLTTREFVLVISDLMMPEMTGVELIEAARKLYPDIAFLMLTGMDSHEMAVYALELGAYGYLLKPFQPAQLLISVANALHRRGLEKLRNEYERRLEREVHERTMDIRQRETEITLCLVAASEYRDEDTGGHVRRVAFYAEAIARELGWSDDNVELIRLSAAMHDIGKIGIPDQILLKAGKLTFEEFEVMEQHTVIGASILSGSKNPLMRMASEVALSHHERWDGAGYPRGLFGENIPECARITAIADVYDALRTERVYRPAFSEDEAFTIMFHEKETHFDPHIFGCLDNIHEELARIRQTVTDSPYDHPRHR